MTIPFKMTNWVLRRVFQTVCRIDVPQIRTIPTVGPLILVANHINFLEVPVLVPHLDNPAVIGLSKKESWDNPLFNFLFNQWQAIPIERGVVDRDAFRQCLEVLAKGKILAISPEGTRSINGRLQQAKPGVVALALRSQAPLIPVAMFGHENFWQNFKHLRRTDFHVAVGKPFQLNLGEEGLSRDGRQAVADEIMYKLAELLPERYRGVYQGVDQVKYKYVV
jgi:1-acyl-sn-glycerol-3-phosphate acyltransferase